MTEAGGMLYTYIPEVPDLTWLGEWLPWLMCFTIFFISFCYILGQ